MKSIKVYFKILFFCFSFTSLFSQYSQCGIDTNFNGFYDTFEYYFFPEVKKISSSYEIVEIENEYSLKWIKAKKNFTQIKALIIRNFGKYDLDLSVFPNLEFLYMTGLDRFPNEIFQLKKIKHLNLIGKYDTIPPQIWNIKSLETLSINSFSLKNIGKPELTNSNLKHLKLNIEYSDTTLFSFNKFEALEFLHIRESAEILNNTIGQIISLKCAKLPRFHNALYNLKNLESLYLFNETSSNIDLSKLEALKEIVAGKLSFFTLPLNQNLKNIYLFESDHDDLEKLIQLKKLEYLYVGLTSDFTLLKEYTYPLTLKKFRIGSDHEIFIEELKTFEDIPDVFIVGKKVNIMSEFIDDSNYELSWSYNKEKQLLKKECK